MRSKTFVYVVVAAALFASGIAVGQRGAASKFHKYVQPSVRTEMDSIALETTVDLILGSLPYRDGLSIPKTTFDYKENRLQAWVLISSDFEKAPLETVKTQIGALYKLEYVHLKASIPELSEDDFVLNVNRGSNFQPFAECRHGNIVFH
jgi:hypothetical protein